MFLLLSKINNTYYLTNTNYIYIKLKKPFKSEKVGNLVIDQIGDYIGFPINCKKEIKAIIIAKTKERISL